MYWFYHEYLDEARRMRIHRIECETEQEGRKLHRQACEFRWVTQHVEPSVSSLFTRGEYGPRTLAPGHRRGEQYHTEVRPIEMPDYIRQVLRGFRMGDEAALSGVRASDDRNPVLDAPSPARTSAAADRADTPF
ncbi:MAG TPA: hypothetical protein VIG24_12170 [Acidimicrobiia bacterium]